MSNARNIADLAGDTSNLESLSSAYGAGALSNRNLIINGAFQIAQRGTSSTSGGFQTVDRFRADINNGTVTMSQESLTSGDPYDLGFRNFYRITNTTSGGSTSDRRKFFTEIEAQNVANSGWNYTSTSSYITVSFWVRASVAGDYYFGVQNKDGTQYAYNYKETLAANTWTKVVKSIPGNSNLTINNDTGGGLRVNFNQYHGTDWTGGSSLDEWAVANNNARYPDDTNGWGTTTGATYDVTGVQLEVGPVATPFEHRSYGQELALCQRYFQISQMDNNISYRATSAGTGTPQSCIFIFTTMRAAPSSTITSSSDGFGGTFASVITNSNNGFRMIGSSSVAQGAFSEGDATVEFDAEL